MVGENSARQWDALLMNEAAIAAHIQDCSTAFVDTELIRDYFFDCGAILERVQINSLREGPADGNVPSERKAREYAKLPAETAPPIVVEGGVVIDGNHRFRDAVARGATEIWCYVAVELPDPRFELAQKRRYTP